MLQPAKGDKSGTALVRGSTLLGAIVAAGFMANHLVPFASPILWAMLFGAALAPFSRRNSASHRFTNSMGKHLLRIGVVLLGLRISIGDLAGLGASGLLTAAGTVAGTLWVTKHLGRRLRLDPDLTLLMGTGTAICGASAIAAVAAANQSKDSHVGYALATITLAGTVAMVVMPLIGEHILHLDQKSLGIWLGASIHEVAQVAGAGAAVSLVALESAMLVKLARVVALGPVVGFTSALQTGSARRTGPVVPGFVVAFLALIVVRSLVDIPSDLVDLATVISTAFLAAGLGGLGLQVHFTELREGGIRPLILGGLSAITAASISLAIVLLTGP